MALSCLLPCAQEISHIGLSSRVELRWNVASQTCFRKSLLAIVYSAFQGWHVVEPLGLQRAGAVGGGSELLLANNP